MLTILNDIFARRTLIWQLVLKNLKLRYYRPALGFFWAVLGPFLFVSILYVVFSLILKVQSEHVPFFLYLMSAVFSWNFFQESLSASTTSLLDNRNLVKEASFPHYLLPISIAFANLLNFLPALAIIIVTSFVLLKGLPLFIIFLPAVLCLHLMITIGLSVMFSVFYVKHRDIKYILDAALMFLFYLTPVFYPLRLARDSFPAFLFRLYSLNPFVGILNLYRVTLLKGFFATIRDYIGPLSLMVMPIGFAVAVILAGFYCYARQRTTINDYLSY